jgi:DNA (cytosine-5)-methyltransferase 1
VFVIATRDDPPAALTGEGAFQTRLVHEARARLPADLAEGWIWWRASPPPTPNADLASLIEPAAEWHDAATTTRLLSLMAPLHRDRLERMRDKGVRAVGAIYRRTRTEKGERRQRAEVRFDGLAGCLRTPRGGSSRQTLVVVEGGAVRTRLITAREGARLMGLPDSYLLPRSATAGLHVMGDGVAVPVVAWLQAQILSPLLAGPSKAIAAE